MASGNYRAGIIGLGMMGGGDSVSAEALGQSVEALDGTHLGALSGHERVDVVAGSSRNSGRRERFAERSGAKVYANFREMLAKEHLDIVSIATYAPVHAENTAACAEAGVRVVYCEKPIATTLADAERIVSSCKKRGMLLVVNHQRRFKPNYQRLRDFVRDGALGDLTSATLQWGAGRLGNMGTHTIDAIRMVTGREVLAVSGHLDLSGKPDCRGAEFRDPGGWGMLKMDDGLIVTVDAADFGTLPLLIAVNGTKGRAVAVRDEMTLEFSDGKTDHWPKDCGESGMDRAVAEIVAFLDDGTPVSAPGEDAAQTLEVIMAFHASHARNAAWVELPLAGADREIEVRSG